MAEAPQPRLAPGAQVVEAYFAGGFKVAGERHEGSLLVFPERVVAWDARLLADVTPASLDPVRQAAAGIEILILGTGPKFEQVPSLLRQSIRAWGPTVDAMATPAACRTYNILLTEGRRVAAALLALPPA